jgi:hypothetical protein
MWVDVVFSRIPPLVFALVSLALDALGQYVRGVHDISTCVAPAMASAGEQMPCNL